MKQQNNLSFKITRQEPELITPAKPTPHQFKRLSDIDDQDGLRFHIPVILFYPKCHYATSNDPVEVIRDAISKALVFYYPFAGRIREERRGRKLAVECTGEGVLFVEADADVMINDEVLKPPFPCLKELLCDVTGLSGVINCPLLLIQVTRLKCGGFVFAIRLNHTMSDAGGLFLFVSAVCEIARGAKAPSILPVWERHLLDAQDPPRVTHAHREYDVVPDKGTLTPRANMVRRFFFFGAKEIDALRRGLPPNFKSCSRFEILTACLWRCRTIAISPDPDEEVRVTCIVNARNRFNPPLPIGYYGNAVAHPVAISKSEDLCKKPLHYALDLVRRTKGGITHEYMKSLANLMVIRGRPPCTVVRNFIVSDASRTKFDKLDFGWGKSEFLRIGNSDVGENPGISTFYIPCKNRGENGVVAPIWLPYNAMAIFVKELELMLGKDNDLVVTDQYPMFVKSAL